jgi:hypothetical protein
VGTPLVKGFFYAEVELNNYGFQSTPSRTIRMGFPTARQFAGTSRFISVLAPITALSPMVTPFRMVVLHPIHTLSPILTETLK